jgi:hypothetical protein
VASSYAALATLATMTDARRSDTERLAAARSGYRALEPRVAAGEPWPLATAFGTEPESSWGPREVLAHVVEMLPFWLGEVERILAGGPEPVPFGRTQDDAMRIGLIERERTLPIATLFDRVDDGLRAWEDRLTDLTEADRERLGRHVRLGDMPMADIPVRFAIGHAEDHIAQLESILTTAGR